MNAYKKLLIRLRSHYLLPRRVIIEPSAKCNLRCLFCAQARFPNQNNLYNPYMSYNLFKSVVDQTRSSLLSTKLVVLTGIGEPFLNPDLIPMIKYAKNSGLKVHLTSNLTVANEDDLFKLIEAKLDRLTVSIDGATKKTFERLRVGGIFEKVLQRVVFTLRTKQMLGAKFPEICFNCVITKENVHEAAKIIRLAEELGVNAVYFNKPFYPGTKFSKVSTYGLNANELFSAKLKVDVTCLNDVVPPCRVSHSCWITFDGKVLPCAVVAMTVPREEYLLYSLGDLAKQSFKEIWFSSRYKELRSKTICLGHGNMPFCAWCPHVDY